MSWSLQQQQVLLSLLSGLCFSGSLRSQKVLLGKVKGPVLGRGVFPHSKAQLATDQGLRFLSSKPVILFLGQGVEEHKEQQGL